MLRKSLPVLIVWTAFRCAQSNVVFDPVVNKPPVASTAATQGTATVSVTFPVADTTHAGQTYTVLVFQNGVLMAGVPSGSVTTGAGGATVTTTLLSPNVSNCLVGSAATLANGSYDIYFAVRSFGDGNVTFSNAGVPCNPNGYIQSSNATLTFLTAHGTLTINGNTTYSISNGNTGVGVKHTFDIQSGPGSTYRCFIVDPNTTSFTSTSHPLAYYTLPSATGTTQGNTPAINLLPTGTYKYYCHADVGAGPTTYFDNGDKVASNWLTINGGNTTVLTTADFSATLP